MFLTRVLVFAVPAAQCGFPTEIIKRGRQLLKHVKLLQWRCCVVPTKGLCSCCPKEATKLFSVGALAHAHPARNNNRTVFELLCLQ